MRSKIFLIHIFSCYFLFAQVSSYKNSSIKLIKKLSSPKFFGRGYVNDGHKKAAIYLRKQFEKQKIDCVYIQKFPVSVVCFDKNPYVKINRKTLKPGYEYLISSCQPTWNSSYKKDDLSKKIYIDSIKREKKPALIITKQLPPAHYASNFCNDSTIYIKKDALPKEIKKIKIKIKSSYKEIESQNVIGFLKGNTDSIVIICAHYDHLGSYGKACYFPGSLDNASGVALMFSLLQYIVEHKLKFQYNIFFIAFGGEELGLKGSTFFVNHLIPYIEPKKIIQVLNLDIVGTGKDGITIVNAESNINLLNHISAKNETENWFASIKTRPNKAISDHYPFSTVGIPSYFIYTLGEKKEYHSVYDTMDNITLSKWESLMEMIISILNFLNSYSKENH